MTKEEKNHISNVLGEYFLRVVKNHDYYLNFKKTFLNSCQKSTSFLKSFGIGDAYMHNICEYANHAEHEFQHHHHENSVYEFITIFINMILKNYLEQGGVDPRKLGMIGQELFDLTCYGVFGDKYLTDMEEMNRTKGNMRAPRNDKEAWLMAEYEQRIKHGEQLDFETFMRERTSVPDEEFWERANRGYEEAIRHHRNEDEYNIAYEDIIDDDAYDGF